MKIKENKEPVSAFAVYSEKLKQKRKPNPLKNAGVHKIVQEKGLDIKKFKQMQEIGMILRQLSKQSNSPNSSSLLQSIEKANVKLEKKPKKSMKKVESIGFSQDCLQNLEVEPDTSKSTNVRKITKSKKSKTVESVIDTSDSSPSEIKTISTNGNHKVGGFNVEIKPTNGNTYSPTLQQSHPEVTKPQKKAQKQKKVLSKGDSQNVSSLDDSNHTMDESSEAKKNVQFKKSRVLNSKLKGLKKTTNESSMVQNSSSIAKNLFAWLVAPVKEQNFMRDYWEKQPLLIQRSEHRNYFSELLSTPAIDKMLRENNLFFTKHLDVTSYTDGVRETHNPIGRAQANVVWDFYSNGCSVRLLNPQAFVPKIHALNSTLQEYFGCFVGANVYLTPPNSQGFAPHYDDIEAFVLQIEGKKQWKVYKPRNDNETLPRFSSRNFSQEEIGEAMLDVVLEPGDMLYFPRGFIHQATTVDNEHSLHITLSAYQKTAWIDLLEKTIPIALKRAAAEDVEFRRGLPRDYLGIENRRNHGEKKDFLQTALGLVRKLEHYVSLSLGAGVDQMGAQFMHDALPPVLIPEEKSKSTAGGGLKMDRNGELSEPVEITPKTEIRLIRPNICRLVEEEEEVRLYHCLDNSLEYHAEEPQFLILPPEGVPVVTLLCEKYPAYVCVESIPHPNTEELLALVSDLWDSGLLLISGL